MHGLCLVLMIGGILATGALLLSELRSCCVYNRRNKPLAMFTLAAKRIKKNLNRVLDSLTHLLHSHMDTDATNSDSVRTVRRVEEPTFDMPLPDAVSLEHHVQLETVEPHDQSSEQVMSEQPITANQPLATSEASTSTAGGTDSILILYVVAYQCDVLYGDPLLRSLLQLGFRYGERSIFHRHLNPIGNGPILFSLVNSVKPGTFDLNNMHEFTTPGVALCMNIPAYGDTLQNFKLMLQAAQRLADEVNGMVLDDERNLLTTQKSEYYKAHIRRLFINTQ